MPTTSFEGAVGEVVRTNPKSSKEIKRAASRLSRALDQKVLGLLQGPALHKVVLAHLDLALARQIASPSHPKRSTRPRGGARAKAIEAGRSFKQTALGADDMLTSDDAARRLGMSREALNQRRKARKVLGLEGAKRGVRYPAWQFEDAVLPAVPRLLQTLSHLDPWGHYLFFTRPEPLLGEAGGAEKPFITPLEALRKGAAKDVIRVADLLAADATGR